MLNDLKNGANLQETMVFFIWSHAWKIPKPCSPPNRRRNELVVESVTPWTALDSWNRFQAVGFFWGVFWGGNCQFQVGKSSICRRFSWANHGIVHSCVDFYLRRCLFQESRMLSGKNRWVSSVPFNQWAFHREITDENDHDVRIPLGNQMLAWVKWGCWIWHFNPEVGED